MSPTGYEVLAEELTADAKTVRGAADKVDKAQSGLRNDGTLPTLDPFGRALGSCLAAFYAVPLVGLDLPFTKYIQDGLQSAVDTYEKALGVDPYPPIRNAWIEALGNYSKLVRTAAKKVDDTATTYQQQEDKVTGSFQNIHAGGGGS